MREAPASWLSYASAAAVVLPLALGLAACGSSSQPPAANPVGTNKTSPTAGPPTPAALVKRVALVDGDFTDGRGVQLFDGGDQVAGQVTLDNCGSIFTTEAHRVARRQTAVVPMNRRSAFFSNEVVAYDSTEQAAKALTELRSSVANCPRGVFIDEAVQGVPDLRYDVSKLRTLASLPVKDNAVAVTVVSAKGTSRHVYGLFIFQRKSTVLSIVYLQSTKKPTAGERATARSLAQITGERLAASF